MNNEPPRRRPRSWETQPGEPIQIPIERYHSRKRNIDGAHLVAGLVFWAMVISFVMIMVSGAAWVAVRIWP